MIFVIEKLGFDATATNIADSDLQIKFKIHEIPDEPSKIDVTGQGAIRVGQENLNFKILDTTRLNRAKLSNGNTLIWGAIDGSLKNIKGDDDMLALGMVYIPETDQRYFTCTIGTLEQGVAAMTFGDYDFMTEEMKNIIKSERNN